MRETFEIRAATLTETEAIGRLLGGLARPGDVIILDGPLGAGKTTLTQSIAHGLEVPPHIYVTSPTFGILHEYPGRIPLYHIDLYRLNGEEDLLDLGLEDYLYGEGVCVVEWPDRLGSLLPEDHLAVRIEHISPASRRFSLCEHGAGWQNRLQELENSISQQTP